MTRRRVLVGAVVALSAVAIGCIYIAGSVVSEVDRMFDPGPDQFAIGLSIPADASVREPLDQLNLIGDPREMLTDAEGDAVVQAARTLLIRPRTSVSIEQPSLRRIDQTQLDALGAFLASSPYWHVGVERGHRFAYRRFAPERAAGLHDSLNGFYRTPFGRREWRVVLGLGGPVYGDACAHGGMNRARSGAGPLDLDLGESGDSFADPTSCLVLDDNPVVVEIWERSERPDRGVTRAALELVEHTLASFLRGDPLAPSTRGVGAIDLVCGMQGGIYTLAATLNAGEPGRVYVRAFEISREIELSASRLRSRTLQEVSYSADPSELFPYDTELTIYEGDWGQYYAARFELWFVPAATGSDERRLLSDVFRIEGWMR